MGKELSSFSGSEAILSHPDKLLKDHLLSVSTLGRRFAEDCACSLTDGYNFAEIAALAGLVHDLGKATPQFQEYIRETDPKRKRKLKADKRTQHGLISAVIGYWIAQDQAENLASDHEEQDFAPYMFYLAIKHHHGNLNAPLESVVIEEGMISTLMAQWEDMNSSMFEGVLESLDITSFYDVIEGRFGSISASLPNRRNLRQLLKQLSTCRYYYLTNLLYSILIDADKTDAGIGRTPEREEIAPGVVDGYRKKKGWDHPQREIDYIRNLVYSESDQRVGSMDLPQRILSMEVPTGLGKTLAAFNCALKLRKRVAESSGKQARIIYALPFLSIIEQNFESILDVLGRDVGSSTILKHHHLSDVFYRDDDDEYTMSEGQLLTEAWNSEIIVTTFVQLFHTLVGYRNRSLKKFHRITNSIVILDEIQALPHKYWLLLRETMRFLSESMNVYFVIVTATKPLIFNDEEVYPLVDNPERYFNAVDRVQLELSTHEAVDLEQFQESVSEEIDGRPEKRFLIVMNTIRSARELYSYLAQTFEDTAYLSTHIIPKHRLDRINRARTGGDIRILVSTQLIEAGVDIDFDVVYRDFAPLDSINQAAGRCNRNMAGSDKGLVRVVKVSSGSRTYASYIYDSLLLNKTSLCLPPGLSSGESEFIRRNNEYYQVVNASMSNDVSRKILESVHKLNYDGSDSSVSTFRLIEEKAGYEKGDVFVEADEEAECIWHEYSKLQEEKDWLKRHEDFLKIKAKFYQYVISIAQRDIEKNCPPIVNGLYFVPRSQMDEYYSVETGFISEGEGSRIW